MTGYLSWRVGMKVVCVKTGQWSRPEPNDPQYGEVYTIRSIQPWGRKIGLRFVEIINPPIVELDGHEVLYNAEHFRPVQKRKTSIEIFERLLTDPHVRIKEDA